MSQSRDGIGQNGQDLIKLSVQRKYCLKSENQLSFFISPTQFENDSSGACRSSFLYSVKQGP